MGTYNRTKRDPLSLVGEIAEAISALPAVATLDWCDRAAACLCKICEPAMACLAVLSIDSIGRVTNIESAGATEGLGTPGTARAVVRPIHSSGSLQLATNARLAALRSRVRKINRLGWSPTGEHLNDTFAAAIDDLVSPQDWRVGYLGRIWGGLDTLDLLIGLIPMGGQNDEMDETRVIYAQVAPLRQGSRVCDEDIAVMRAVLPLLHRRALMAVGATRADPNRWLTAREHVILEELTLGKTVKEIAQSIGRSPHTVHDHVKSLHRKLGASSRGELIARALGHISEGSKSRRSRRVKPMSELDQFPDDTPVNGAAEPALAPPITL